jgi:LemA protein
VTDLPLAVLAVLLFLASVVLYNRLVRSRLRTEEAWSGVDVQLKRRADLIPHLVEVTKGYAAHERETLESVIAAREVLRNADGPAQSERADRALAHTLTRLLAVVEAYPELAASESFLKLQGELAYAEEKVAYARHFYNRNVLAYNTRRSVFPSRLIAGAFRFDPMEFFEAEEDAHQLARVDLEVD